MSYYSTFPVNLKSSLGALSREFNELLCIGHMLLGNDKVIHFMEARRRFSARMVADSVDLPTAM